MSDSNERTPLLREAQPESVPAPTVPDGNGNGKHPGERESRVSSLRAWAISLGNALKANVENRILFAGFLITLSFSFTQVPIFYVFHLMECDVFYETHPPYDGPGDRCSRNEIAAGTATQFSILGMSTTFCGTINLFVAGWMAKRFGPRAALMVQTFIPAIRVATQILGVMAGGKAGIIIFQCTQLITVIGGPVGYILVANIIAGELLATGYAPLLIQMYATAVFEFKQSDNGWLMSGFACMRAAFLLFLFPHIINSGRKWHIIRATDTGHSKVERRYSQLPTNPEDLDAPIGSFAEEEPVGFEEVKEDEGTEFDLFFLRASLVIDGVLTMCAAFATERWHIYLGLFGFVFAALARIGKPHLTFFANAAIALLAATVLLFSRFRPEGSSVIEDDAAHVGPQRDNESQRQGA
ncbi:hypothetical protein N0V88_008005 [Collariella sp. IMI 366227]|nr:hypothetical protein N0V88_008005 [Collariella sp. IMI 366227]